MTKRPKATDDSRSRLTLAGEALYSKNGWQSDLAKALGIPLRTMQRWAAGSHPVRESVWPEIASLCRARAKALLKVERVGDYALAVIAPSRGNVP